MSENSREHFYQYYTVPLKFLWFELDDPSNADIKARLIEIVEYSIIRFTNSKSERENDRERLYFKQWKNFNLSPGTYQNALETHRKYAEQLKQGDIITSIRATYLVDALKGRFPYDLLLLLAAVKSVIGMKNFAHTTKAALVNRMYGERNCTLSHYLFNKFVNRARVRGVLNVIPAARGYFVSVKYKDTETFKAAIKTRMEKHLFMQSDAIHAGRELIDLRKQHMRSLKEQNNKVEDEDSIKNKE
jgi:hypothetical protein